MARIKDMARITPLNRKVTDMTTPAITNATRLRGNGNNPGFKKWISDRHDQQLNLQDIILVALEELQEPVSTLEMQAYLKAEAGIDLIDYRVKYALEQLVAARKVSARIETPEERKLRADGLHVSPKPAYLFNSGTTPRPRTVAHVVEGYTLYDVAEGAKSRAGRPRKQKTVNVTKPIGAPDISRSSAPAPVSAPSNAAIDYLIEKLVADRTRELQAQLDEANAKLAQFRKLLS